MTPEQIYAQAHDEARDQLQTLQRRSTVLGITRFVCILLIIVPLYFYLYNFAWGLLALSILGLAIFIYLVTLHERVRWGIKNSQTQTDQALAELTFLEKNYFPFPTGEEYKKKSDFYVSDLDILGDHSLYQYLCRCKTYLGQKTLADWVQTEVTREQILSRAESNKELRDRTDFRKQFWVQSELAALDESRTRALARWDRQPIPRLSRFSLIAMYLVPALFWACTLIELVWQPFGGMLTVLKYGCGAMILLLLLNLKTIRQTLQAGEKLSPRLQALSSLWELIESEHLSSPALVALQKNNQTHSYSTTLHRLSRLISHLESLNNPLGAFIINAFIPYHLFYYQQLALWKEKNSEVLTQLPADLGLWETYLSLAQYSYNETHNHYPSYDDSQPVSVTQAWHPLMRRVQAVANSLSFERYRFFILTGSNMSGKSTFLRTMGSITVLSKLGTRISAQAANLHVRPLYASMRVSDSLADQSSYFHAELTKLKTIMDESETAPAQVLLDEILRGTNSEDKRTGTMDVIERFLEIGSMGIIATHDLEVCKLAERHPQQVHNICFESEIVEGDLFFDYTLKDGICQNKNATFLLHKMGII